MLKLEGFMDIFRLKEHGLTLSSISKENGLDRKTIRKYLRQGNHIPPKMKMRSQRKSKLRDFEADILFYIQKSESEWPPAMVIYETLIKKGYTGSLSLLQKWLKQYRQKQFPRVVIRYETEPGKQAQVNWGEQKITDKQTEITKEVYIFCLTLSWSRNRFVFFSSKADMYHFLLGHKKAFTFSGGVWQEILYDRNRCVIVKPAAKDTQYNHKFIDFARHYGFYPRLCRPYRPQTKGKVENLVRYVKKNFRSIQESNNLNILKQNGTAWLKQVNNKVHTTTGKIPSCQLPDEKLVDIKAIADHEIDYIETRKVFNDSTFSSGSQRYSVPPLHIGKMVTIKYRPGCERLDVFHDHKRITQHRRDDCERYVIKHGHRSSIWRLWRHDKNIFYQPDTYEKKNKQSLSGGL